MECEPILLFTGYGLVKMQIEVEILPSTIPKLVVLLKKKKNIESRKYLDFFVQIYNMDLFLKKVKDDSSCG